MNDPRRKTLVRKQILTCERNALRYEQEAGEQKMALVLGGIGWSFAWWPTCSP